MGVGERRYGRQSIYTSAHGTVRVASCSGALSGAVLWHDAHAHGFMPHKRDCQLEVTFEHWLRHEHSAQLYQLLAIL